MTRDEEILYKRINKMAEEIVTLKARNAKLTEALKFYASTSMWNATTYESTRDGVCCSDFSAMKSIAMGPSQVGGKRAREALKANEGEG